MSHPTRAARRRSFHLGLLDSGDYVILLACVLLFFAMFLNWWISGGHVNALSHSGLYVLLNLILLLVAIVLVIYPPLEPELNLPPLPFATPLILLGIGFLMLIDTTYELGRYTGVDNIVGIAPGFGLWLAFVATLLYLFGAIIKWGSRTRRR